MKTKIASNTSSAKKFTMMKMLRTTVVATCALLLSAVSAQLPIPGKPPGFTVGHGSADAGVQLETFVDLVSGAKSSFPEASCMSV